ncbi:type III secretion system stator protein SctL [Bradyrhizobium cenepequi]|uniref:type III secretion system stator protein SctL n=1 Tax=Bradyrhizobium cenepequi TaxID=2821403 RepID=UPI001CE2AFBA|nr:type III secretion system stator protein SctL [Bradyrhizobium cenepequi]MCA6105787.1 type III secretion system stator protein SctL [Bradyrhizobium cenepequi]
MPLEQTEAPTPPRLRPLGPLVRQEEFNIWGEAQSALDAAERHHAHMRDWTRAIYRRERQRGRDEGLAIGREEASRLIAATSARTNAYLRRLEQDVPTLVLDVIENLLGRFDPGDLLAHAVRHALTKLQAGGEMRLRVAPEQSMRLREALAELGDHGGSAMIEIEVDPTLASGQCVLWSEFGNIELGLEAQLSALRRGLLAHHDHGDAGNEASQ